MEQPAITNFENNETQEEELELLKGYLSKWTNCKYQWNDDIIVMNEFKDFDDLMK